MPSESPHRLVFSRTGRPAEVLELTGFQPAAPQDGELLVRMLAAPLNPADLNFIEGTYGVAPALPAVPGIEGCGVVKTSRSPHFSPGERVIFLRKASSWASHVTVSASSAYKIPAGMDPHQAALLRVNPATAWQLLHAFADLKPGDWIVQNAGNSAVGRCVIQLAGFLGLRSLSFVRRPELIAELQRLGADHVGLDDEAGHASAKQALGNERAPVAFNAVGGDSALRLMKLLRDEGVHVTYGAMARKPVTVPNGLLIFRNIRICGLWVTRWLENAPDHEVRKTYDLLAARVADGKLTQPIDSVFPLKDYQNALARLDAPGRSGKVLFSF